MGTYNRAVKEQVFHVGFINEMEMHRFPDTVVTPPGKSFVNTVPMTVFLW
jgi:hypothetical protein